MRTISLSTSAGNLGALAAGDPATPALVLLHGWPQCKELWEPVIEPLARQFFVIAPDLPGIGRSSMPSAPTMKHQIADLVIEGVEGAGGARIVVAGVDVGGTVAFAAARDHGRRIRGAVIMNTIVPGVGPWDQVIAEPQIWHFAFHATPRLPELLVAGHRRTYFDFFTDFLSGNPKAISDAMRSTFAEAYRRPDALATGFGWYRAFPDDVRHNRRAKRIDTPILYVRGDADGRSPRSYVAGLRAAGARDVRSVVIANCGELVSLEQPEHLVAALSEFADTLS